VYNGLKIKHCGLTICPRFSSVYNVMTLTVTYTTRGIQKVRILTPLITRYVHHILSLFNIVSCNWNVLGPAFLQSSDSMVEKLLIMLFQPAICQADSISPSILPLCMGDLSPYLIYGSLTPLESTPKWHLDRFSCFHRAHDCDRPTNRQIDRQIKLLHV